MTLTQPAGYLALPASGKGAPILVLHAWWGLNAAIKALCDRLAAQGFVAFAPDLYNGKIASTIPEAEVLRDEMDGNPDQASATVAAAAAYLSAHPAATDRRLAVMGFSLGAYYALELSVSDPERVRAVVVFYGVRPADDYARSQAAYLGHFAEHDDYEPREDMEEMEASLRQAGRPVTFYTYPNTGHWFFEPDRADAYNPAAADLAWQRTLDFLKKELAS